MEGARNADAELHLRHCSHCNDLVRDLEAISSFAGTLDEEEFQAAPRVWNTVRAQLEKEGIIHESGFAHRIAEWLGGLAAAVPRPALAGAYLALMVAGGLLLGLHHSSLSSLSSQSSDSRWYNGTQANMASFSSALDSAERVSGSDEGDPNPMVAASLHKSLALVDNYIRLCEQSVREEPQNEAARDYLYGAYQQKAELLNEISERGVAGR